MFTWLLLRSALDAAFTKTVPWYVAGIANSVLMISILCHRTSRRSTEQRGQDLHLIRELKLKPSHRVAFPQHRNLNVGIQSTINIPRPTTATNPKLANIAFEGTGIPRTAFLVAAASLLLAIEVTSDIIMVESAAVCTLLRVYVA